MGDRTWSNLIAALLRAEELSTDDTSWAMGEIMAGSATPVQIAGCLGYCTAFYRHYLGDELTEPGRYGRLVYRMMAALDAGIPLRALRTGRRRIGVVSPHLREHTVARLFVPLLESLDRERFELVVFSLDDRDDVWSRRLRAIARMQTGPAALPEWRRRIVAAAPVLLAAPVAALALALVAAAPVLAVAPAELPAVRPLARRRILVRWQK